MTAEQGDRVATWMAALEARHLSELRFPEVSRALRALSSAYVERRPKLSEGAALSGAGKRAAFALFYAPLHFFLVKQIVSALGEPFTTADTLLDLGCGTGAAGAGWAMACARAPHVTAIDRHPWAVSEARHTFEDLGLRSTVRVDDLTRVTLERFRDRRSIRLQADVGAPAEAGAYVHAESGPHVRPTSGVLLAFAVNEIADEAKRAALLERLLEHAAAGGHVLVVEPIARSVSPWWNGWRRRFEAAGGRGHEWRFRSPLPPIVEKLDRAAGLDHREQTGRTLVI